MTRAHAPRQVEAAYVPIDLAHPASRVAYMIEHAAAQAALLALDDTLELPNGFGGPVVKLHTNGSVAEISAAAPGFVSLRGSARLPAGTLYIMYTSGSTSPGRHCHSTLSLTAIHCHSLAICTVIVLSLLSVSAQITVPPVARQHGAAQGLHGEPRRRDQPAAVDVRSIPFRPGRSLLCKDSADLC